MAFAATPDRGEGALVRRAQTPARDSRREREFQRARRHSSLVAVLKFMLPLMAVGILSLYVLPSFLRRSIDHGRGTASVRGISLEAGSLKMIEPRVKGVNERGEAYDIRAVSATQASKNAEVMYLDTVRGKMTGLDGRVTLLTAPNAVHNSKAEEITFGNGVVVTRDGGMTATFQTGTAYMKSQVMVSKTPVEVRLQESTILSENMTLYWGEGRAVFEGNVRTHIERGQDAAPSAAPAAQRFETRAVDAAPAE